MAKNATENLPIHGLVGIDRARALNKQFKDYVKDLTLGEDDKNLLTTPVIIDQAKDNFNYILTRVGCEGLRAYPGLDTKDGITFFTLIFIGFDKDGNNIIIDTGSTDPAIPAPTGQQGQSTPLTDPPIQDNNSPCKPPCKPL